MKKIYPKYVKMRKIHQTYPFSLPFTNMKKTFFVPLFIVGMLFLHQGFFFCPTCAPGSSQNPNQHTQNMFKNINFRSDINFSRFFWLWPDLIDFYHFQTYVLTSFFWTQGWRAIIPARRSKGGVLQVSRWNLIITSLSKRDISYNIINFHHFYIFLYRFKP